MAQIVKLRRSSVSGQKPTNSNLQLGELALNTTDGKVFMAVSGSGGPSVEEIILTNTVNTGSINIIGSISGSYITGAFIGDGSGLYNLPVQNINTASLATTGSNTFIGDQTITGSINITGTVDGVDISQFSSSVDARLNSVTASGGISAIYIADEGSVQGTASYFDFIGAGITAAVNNGTASITVTATGGGGSAIQGASQTYTQTTNATTWSIDHSINSRTPVVEVYDQNYNVIIPTGIYNPGAFQTLIYFDVEQRGYAIISTGGGLTVDGANAILDQAIASSTWTFNHNLGTKYPVFNIFDNNDDVIIPQRINVVDENTAVIYFSSARSGKAVASVGGDVVNSDSSSFSVSSSFATNANLLDGKDSSEFAITGSNIFNGNQVISGSLTITNNLNVQTALTASGLNYPTIDGLENQVLETDGNGNLIFDDIHTMLEDVYAGENLTKGDPLYVSGSQGAKPIVYRADASDPTKMPVTFIAQETIGANNDTRGIILGLIEGIDLTGFPAGTEIYIASGGGWSATRPTGSAIVQVLGYVSKGDGPGGKGLVLNPGPNSLPNLESGHVWVGNSNWIPTTISTSSFSTGSFTGSFIGDGSELYNIPASGVTGLQLDKIINGNASASIDETGLYVNRNLYIAGTITSETTLVSGSSQISYTGITDVPSGIISGSVQVDITETTGYATFSGSISSSINQLSSSIAITTNDLDSRVDSLETESGSIRGDFNSYTASADGRLNSLENVSSSFLSFSSSFENAIEITGSNVTIKGDLLVKGTETKVDSTTIQIGDNIIELNGTGATNAGLVVRDVTNPNTISGSLLWDTTNDYWVAGPLGSEERIVLEGEFNTFTSSTNSSITNINSVTNSLNSYTSSTDIRINSLEVESGSIRGDFNSYTSSTDNRLGLIEIESSSIRSNFNSYTSSTDIRINSLEVESGSVRNDFNSFTSSYNTSSFTGSFTGDGSGLYNVPASGVTGLQLDKIADGSVTASVSEINGFVVNTDTIITGSLTATALSGSLDFDYLINVPTLVSSSDQLTGSYDTRYVLSGSITQTTWDNIANKPSGIVSSSSQISEFGFLETSSFNSFTSSYTTGSFNGSFTGSLFGTASYALVALSSPNSAGLTTNMTQSSPSLTWSFVHNLNTRYPIIQVYNDSYNQIIPNEIVGIDEFTAEIRFDYEESGYAVASNGGSLNITGSTSRINQTESSTTWSFTHNLGTKYPSFEVYDSDDNVIIPAGIKATSINTAEIYFATPTSGIAIANFSGLDGSLENAVTSSFALATKWETIEDKPITGSLTNATAGTTTTIMSIATGSYYGAFFDYVVVNGSNSRAGTVMSTWNGSSVVYNESATNDIGDTSEVTMSVDLSGENVRLRSTNTNQWSIKSLVRLI